MRCLGVLLLALLSVAVPAPASAKGPTHVEITGPGIDGMRIDAWDLMVTTGLYQRPRALPARQGSSDLGPAYRLAWSVGDVALTTSHAYPFSRGSWVRLPSGWFRGGPELRRKLESLGASDRAASAEAVRRAAYLLARGAWAAVHGRLPTWPQPT